MREPEAWLRKKFPSAEATCGGGERMRPLCRRPSNEESMATAVATEEGSLIDTSSSQSPPTSFCVSNMSSEKFAGGDGDEGSFGYRDRRETLFNISEPREDGTVLPVANVGKREASSKMSLRAASRAENSTEGRILTLVTIRRPLRNVSLISASSLNVTLLRREGELILVAIHDRRRSGKGSSLTSLMSLEFRVALLAEAEAEDRTEDKGRDAADVGEGEMDESVEPVVPLLKIACIAPETTADDLAPAVAVAEVELGEEL